MLNRIRRLIHPPTDAGRSVYDLFRGALLLWGCTAVMTAAAVYCTVRVDLAAGMLLGVVVLALALAATVFLRRVKRTVRELETGRDRSEQVHRALIEASGVLGLTEVLLDSDLSLLQRQYAQGVRSSAEGLLQSINDILEFSRIEAGKVELDRRPFDLRTVVEESAELLAPRAQAKGLELVCDIDENVPRIVVGDGKRLRQVLVNLIGNAVKFTARGEVSVKVSRPGTPKPGSECILQFAVRDSGTGIAPEDRDRLFDALDPANSPITRRAAGTGFGLALCKRLVTLMAGRIDFDSTPGEGSTFHFSAAFQPMADDKPPKPLRFLRGLRALVVAPNANLSTVLQARLRAMGLSPDVCGDGRSALSVLAAKSAAGKPYALAIIDMSVADIPCTDLARSIRSDTQLSRTRLFLMTALSPREPGSVRDFDGFFSKPVRESSLVEVLGTVMADPDASQGGRARTRSVKIAIGAYILLAEDDAINRVVCSTMLQRLGCKVDFVADGQTAVEQSGRARYDLVLMDCQMPLMDGFEATQAIRARERQVASGGHTSVRLPIIALTANAIQGDRERCLASGMDDYMTKPFKAEALRVMVERWTDPEARLTEAVTA